MVKREPSLACLSRTLSEGRNDLRERKIDVLIDAADAKEKVVTELLLVGCGNMGFAMLGSWIESGEFDPGAIAVVEPDSGLRQRAAGKGVAVFAAPDQVSMDCKPRLVVMAVKPQLMAGILPLYRPFAECGSAFLSVAAGTRIALFEQILGESVPVIRCMPNTPAAIGQGMMVAVANSCADADLKAYVERILSANGKVAFIAEEGLMDAVTAVSGSGPAYLFHFIECLGEAAVKAGLPPDLAALLAKQTVVGAAMLAAGSTDTPAELRRQVTSPNGTTAAALEVLMGDDRLKKLLTDAVDAARRRSVELG